MSEQKSCKTCTFWKDINKQLECKFGLVNEVIRRVGECKEPTPEYSKLCTEAYSCDKWKSLIPGFPTYVGVAKS